MKNTKDSAVTIATVARTARIPQAKKRLEYLHRFSLVSIHLQMQALSCVNDIGNPISVSSDINLSLQDLVEAYYARQGFGSRADLVRTKIEAEGMLSIGPHASRAKAPA